MKKLLELSKFLVITLVFSLFWYSQSAIAAMGMPAIDSILESVQIEEGKFSVDVADISIPTDLRVGSAVVSLPDGETGTIDEISITGSNGKIFGCKNLKVQNGTDLIKSCGGPAYLKTGKTTYQARGSNFQPQADVKFSVELSP